MVILGGWVFLMSEVPLYVFDNQVPVCAEHDRDGPKGEARLLRKVDTRLPGKGNSNSRGARPVYSFDD